jgi:PAS domain S-box-containing protein
MLQHLSTWLNTLPLDDPMDRRQAISLQAIILGVLAVGIIGLPISYDTPSGLPQILSVFANLLVLLCALIALGLLHRGRYRAAVGAIAAAILLGASLNLVISGFAHIQGLVLIFALPLVLASILIGRKALVGVALITIIIFVTVAILEQSQSPLVGFLPESGHTIISTVAALILSIGLIGLFLDQFSATWRHAFNDLRRMNARLQIELCERQKIGDALRESEARYRLIAENSTDLIGIVNVAGCFVYVSLSFGVVLGYPPQSLIGKSAWDGVHPADLPEVLATWEQVLEQQHTTTTYRIRSSTDEWFWFETQNTVATWNNEPVVVIVGRNITERRRLEAQLQQAQKMEGIGRLAGGIAHDFNNLLVVIDGYTDLVIESLPVNTPAWEDLQEVQKATHRAANLTRQLLAFARRQINDPRVMSISNLITDMDMLLRRLIREDIELIINAPADLWPVRMDATQAEQVIVNLVVNARDAMPNGGQLVIELANVTLEQEYLQHIAITPGHYVIITLSDTGVGMDAEVQRHIFEPFFTTKEIGHGTGLGLATCYGIIKQNNGTIWVYSEPGQGTTIKIYLPRAEGFAQNIIHREPHNAIPGGSETILLVEDELAVRELIARVLRGHGYRVAEAATGEEALAITKNIGASAIDLLLTDVVMPKMGGQVLAARIIQEYPATRVLYTSGYTDTAIVTRGGQLNPGTALLQKPFTSATLACKVREVLDA